MHVSIEITSYQGTIISKIIDSVVYGIFWVQILSLESDKNTTRYCLNLNFNPINEFGDIVPHDVVVGCILDRANEL